MDNDLVEILKLSKGVRVDGDKVIIAVKDNDAARWLCGLLIHVLWGEK